MRIPVPGDRSSSGVNRSTERPVAAPKYREAALIYNPKSGRRRRLRPRQIATAAQWLERAGIQVTPCPTTGPGTATELARKAIRNGADLIVVCGGDGTVNEVVCGMARSRVPMAVLPAGTANVLARELRLPRRIGAAARAIPTSTPRRLALGLAGNRYFLLMAGVGLDAQVIRKLEPGWKNRLGIASYVLEAIRQAMFEAPAPFIVSTADRRIEATFACISKSTHYGTLRMVREADMFSENFFVYCFRPRNRLRYFLYVPALLTGRLQRLEDVIRFPARKVRCERIEHAAGDVMFQVDGELAGRLPCTVEIVPDALTLLVPASAANREKGAAT